MIPRERIDEFLSQKRLAMVGVSRNWKDFSRLLYREFQKRGYDMVPVHPAAEEIEGAQCFRSMKEIDPPVDGVLLMTKPDVTERIVQDCAEAGIGRVWMYRGGGPGAVSQRAVDFCDESGIQVIPGYCPYMFFEKAGFVHSFHAFLMKLTGKYPH